jgi:hypothetical protein
MCIHQSKSIYMVIHHLKTLKKERAVKHKTELNLQVWTSDKLQHASVTYSNAEQTRGTYNTLVH